MFLKKIIVVFSIICSPIVWGQSNVDYSLYNYSLNLINPAFAGQKQHTELLVNSKMQWIGIKDAPRTSTFSLNVPFKSGLGIGVSVINDKIFIFNQTNIALDFSYKVKLTDDHDLQFGFKAIGNIYNGDINKIRIEEQNDEFFADAINKFSPNFTLGGAIVHQNYFMHMSINNVLVDNKYEELNNSKNSGRFNTSLGGGYTFIINDNLKLTPSTLVRVEEGTPLSFDLNGTLEINEKHNVGLSYFWNNSIQVNGVASLSNWIKLGYGYRLYTNGLGSEQNGTHEFIALFNMDDIF
ncbi:PorP/SprF family type IX secretion system membrane protein [Tenacibaculum sp. nBUS_03]|uniref:PorP/SprF family type IX secretion system membrane protein n=1 Tax=Tenacibaculum sp. nBUS_03 TaxID=3395320 RepID=UPI003EBBE7DC